MWGDPDAVGEPQAGELGIHLEVDPAIATQIDQADWVDYIDYISSGAGAAGYNNPTTRPGGEGGVTAGFPRPTLIYVAAGDSSIAPDIYGYGEGKGVQVLHYKGYVETFDDGSLGGGLMYSPPPRE